MLSAESKRYFQRLSEIDAYVKSGRIIRYFPDVHLGKGHRGLTALAALKKIKIEDLGPGEFVIFVNRSQTGLKLFAPGNCIAYLKMPGSQKIDTRIISMIPRFFNGSKINYDGALKEKIEKDFGFSKKLVKPLKDITL